jgi:hypothetical protein
MRLASRTAALTVTTVAALALVSGTAVAAPSGYPPPSGPVIVAEGLVTPLSFDVSARGDLYVGQAFAGVLTHVPKRGAPTDVVTGAPEVVAVSVDRGVLTWAESIHDEATFAPVSAVLKKRAHDGTVTEVDLLAYESQTNADGGVTYGVLGLSPACQATLPPFLQPSTGGIDSHPYGSVSTHGGTYVADAGANAVLRVDRRGQVSTVAVLPPTVVDLTPEMVAAAGLDPCVADGAAHLEPVPTDVEVGKHGMLYVSTLPGGPEDGSLGANGSVYRVHPRTGAVEMVATGFAGATNVAVAPNGTVYVAEMFGGKVSAISRSGDVSTVLEVAEPAAVEWHSGRLYVSSGVFTQPGAVVALRLPRW